MNNLVPEQKIAGCPSTRVTLLQKVKNPRDSEAWRQFVDQYSPLVFGYCRQQGLQDADARDVTQVVFLAVSRAMGQFAYDRDKGRFRSWLGTITIREIRRHQNSARRQVRAAAEEGDVAQLASLRGVSETSWETHFHSYMYRIARRRIRPHFGEQVWRAFELSWDQQRPVAEVASALQREAQWVYTARFKVLRRLRAEVQHLAENHPLLARR